MLINQYYLYKELLCHCKIIYIYVTTNLHLIYQYICFHFTVIHKSSYVEIVYIRILEYIVQYKTVIFLLDYVYNYVTSKKHIHIHIYIYIYIYIHIPIYI